MKILVISHSAHLGGAERSLLTLIRQLHGKEEIRVVFPETGELTIELKNLGVKFYVANYSWWTIGGKETPKKNIKDLKKYINEAKKLHKLLLGWKPDIIYTNSSVVCVGGLLAQMLEVPHVWHIREFGEKDHGFIFEYGLKNTSRMIEKLSTATIFNSKATRREFIEVRNNTNVIYNAVEIPKIKNDPKINYFKYKNSLKVLIAGTISERKGQLDGVKAIATLIEKGTNVELILVGHCNYEELKAKIEGIKYSSKDPSRIQLLDYTNNPYTIFREADLVLVTSKNEAFGRTILEGWILNKPVVATNSGGIPEIIDDNTTGLLYKPGNIEELSNKIGLLKENKLLRQNLAQNGHNMVKTKFNIEKYVTNVENVLRDACRTGFEQLKTPLESITG